MVAASLTAATGEPFGAKVFFGGGGEAPGVDGDRGGVGGVDLPGDLLIERHAGDEVRCAGIARGGTRGRVLRSSC